MQERRKYPCATSTQKCIRYSCGPHHAVKIDDMIILKPSRPELDPETVFSAFASAVSGPAVFLPEDFCAGQMTLKTLESPNATIHFLRCWGISALEITSRRRPSRWLGSSLPSSWACLRIGCGSVSTKMMRKLTHYGETRCLSQLFEPHFVTSVEQLCLTTFPP